MRTQNTRKQCINRWNKFFISHLFLGFCCLSTSLSGQTVSWRQTVRSLSCPVLSCPASGRHSNATVSQLLCVHFILWFLFFDWKLDLFLFYQMFKSNRCLETPFSLDFAFEPKLYSDLIVYEFFIFILIQRIFRLFVICIININI